MHPISMTLINEEKIPSSLAFWVFVCVVMVAMFAGFVYSLSFLVESKKSKHSLSDRVYYKREASFYFACNTIIFSLICPFLLLAGGILGAFGYSKQTYNIQGKVEEINVSACDASDIFNCKPGVVREFSVESVGTVKIKDGATDIKAEDLVMKTVSVDCHYRETRFWPFGSVRDLDPVAKCDNIRVMNDSIKVPN